MPVLRLPLAESPEGRTASAEKDSLLINAYRETDPDGIEHVVKRAGLETAFSYDGIGQGFAGDYPIVDGSFQGLPVFYSGGRGTIPYINEAEEEIEIAALGDGTLVDRSPLTISALGFTPRDFGVNALCDATNFVVYVTAEPDGHLYAFGNNSEGSFVNGTTTQSDVIVPSITDTVFTLLPSTSFLIRHVFLAADKSLWYRVTGTGALAQMLSNGVVEYDWAFFLCGAFTWARKENGTLWRTTVDMSVAVQVGTDADWGDFTGYSTGPLLPLAIKGGQLVSVDSTLISSPVITVLQADTDWKSVGMWDEGVDHGVTYYALKESGALYVKGSNTYGECGTGNTDPVLTWTQILPALNFSYIPLLTVLAPICAITDGGDLYAWGSQITSYYDLLGTASNINPTPLLFSAGNWVKAKFTTTNFYGIRNTIWTLNDAVIPFQSQATSVGFLLKSSSALYYYEE